MISTIPLDAAQAKRMGKSTVHVSLPGGRSDLSDCGLLEESEDKGEELRGSASI